MDGVGYVAGLQDRARFRDKIEVEIEGHTRDHGSKDMPGADAEFEMPAVALTDHGSLAGAVELYRHAHSQGIKPIIGCEVYVTDDQRSQTKGYVHLTLLARDDARYANLIRLASAG